jgi:hypothetical protein
MTQNPIVESTASGSEIQAIVNRIEPILDGTPVPHAIISLLSIILMLSKPAITPDELQLGVQDISRYICFYLEGTGEVAMKRMN